MSKHIYYGRISTIDGQTSATQFEAEKALGVHLRDTHFDEGVSGYHVAPLGRPGSSKVEAKLRRGDVLYVRWLDRISRNYDELHTTMQRLMVEGVKVVCTLNSMEFDGAATDAIQKATRDALLAFMAAQGEADYLNRREMQREGEEGQPREVRRQTAERGRHRSQRMAGREQGEHREHGRALRAG